MDAQDELPPGQEQELTPGAETLRRGGKGPPGVKRGAFLNQTNNGSFT